MSIRSREIGWSQESNLLWQILKQLNRLTSVIFALKQAATPTYKVFTALAQQNGGSVPREITNDFLIVGRTYKIASADGGTVDFTNVGAPNNDVDTSFIATGTTPNSWGETNSGILAYDEGAPILTVLENTLGNIWIFYNSSPGNYVVASNQLFTDSKTSVTIGTNNLCCALDPYGLNNISYGDPSSISITTADHNGSLQDNQLYLTTIEIRVYN